jgi:hypothetical protein
MMSPALGQIQNEFKTTETVATLTLSIYVRFPWISHLKRVY